MKKFILTIAIIVVATVTMNAQNSYERIYNRFSSAQGAENVKVSPLLMGISRMIIDEEEEDAQILKGIKSILVMDLSDCSEEVRKEFCEAASDIDITDMELLLEMSDNSDLLKIFVKRSGETISQFLMINTGIDDPCMVSMACKVNMKDVAKLASVAQNK